MAKPTKSILTKYEQYSVFSGSPATCSHHLCYGKYGSWRDLSEKFGLKIPLTDSEHNMSSKGTINQIHGNPAAEKLSKICGQVAYQELYLAKKLASEEKSAEEWIDEAREDFRRIFGESLL